MPFLLLSLVLSAVQVKGQGDVCPWCRNDPALMAAAGVVSHGPIALGPKGSEEVAGLLPGRKWIFLETAHLRWGSNLGPTAVEMKDRKRVEAELARLRKVLPAVPRKADKLDPYLRLHLFAMKAEEFYGRFQRLLRVKDEDFAARTRGGVFMGAGPFLGEKEKFEVILHAERGGHRRFTQEAMGVQITDALRWHFPQHHKMHASIPAEDGDLREDGRLYPHVVHNLSHLFLCAYKHFSYDPPVWLDEGLAHAMEREVEPESVTFDGDEGAIPSPEGSSDWSAVTRKILGVGKAASLAELWHKNAFGELSREDHVIAWSKVRFLIDEKGEDFAKILAGLKGQLDEKGVPTGRDIHGLQRRLLKEILGFHPEGFDSAWRVWAIKQP